MHRKAIRVGTAKAMTCNAFRAAFGWGAVILSVSAAVPAAIAQQAPAAMIILDGSGSFWGKIEGDKRAKLDISRDAVRSGIAKSPQGARIGLMSFGPRCTDAGILVQAEAGTAERIGGVLDKLNPRGKGPVGLALKEAAKSLKERAPAAIVLIADNADNCGVDACAAAEEIAKTQPGLAIHVVGVGLEGEDARKLVCVSKATGGKFHNAENAVALTGGIEEAVKLALRGGAPAPAAAAETKLQSLPKVQPPPGSPDGPPAVSLTAKLGKEGDALDMPVRWRVTREGDAGAVVLEFTGAHAAGELPAGKYTVEARLGLATVRQPLEVKAVGTTSLALPLEAAAVVLSGRGKSGELAQSVITVLPAGADGKPQPQGAPLLVSRDIDGVLVVPAGAYVMRIENGIAHKDLPVQAASGGRIPIDTTLGAGRLQLWAEAQEGGEAQDGVLFTLAEDDPDAPNGRREIARSAAARPEFVVPAGTYYVTAQIGLTAVRQRVAIGAGDTLKRGIVLNIAKVMVNIDAASIKAEVPVATRVIRLDGGEPREVARGFGKKPEFQLAAGRYRVEAQAGDQNARVAGEIEVKPGRNLQMAMRIDAGRIALRAVDMPGGFAFPDAFWEIRDGKGQVVWRTSQAEPWAVLAPGRYVVRSEVRERRLDKTVDVAAGDVRAVEIGPQ